MSKIIKQDITTVENGVIMHQVNRQGIMGAGVARALANKFPGLESTYAYYCNNNNPHLGDYCFHCPNPDITILNIFAQDLSSSDPRFRTRATSYDAIAFALETYVAAYKLLGETHYAPYLMGCGLGGGSWNIYKSIVEEYIPDVMWCHL
jgi:hypothetical protein